MRDATIDTENAIVRFVDDGAAAWIEVEPRGGRSPRRVRCSPYHLFCVLQGLGYCLASPGDAWEFTPDGDAVALTLESENRFLEAQLPRPEFERALATAFGVQRAAPAESVLGRLTACLRSPHA